MIAVALKIARYDLDNWAELRQYMSVDTIRIKNFKPAIRPLYEKQNGP